MQTLIGMGLQLTHASLKSLPPHLAIVLVDLMRNKHIRDSEGGAIRGDKFGVCGRVTSPVGMFDIKHVSIYCCYAHIFWIYSESDAN